MSVWDESDPERFVEPSYFEDEEAAEAYETCDPKHPGYHTLMTELWDNRDKTESR